MSRLKEKSIYAMLFVSLFVFIGPVAVSYSAEQKTAPVADSKSNNMGKDGEEADKAEERKLPKLGPGQWEPLFELGDSIYPSLVISTATLKAGLWEDDDKERLGDKWGIIGIAVRGIGDNCPVEVEISGASFIRPSVFTGELAKKDIVYCVYPDLKYDYEKLLAVKQTIPETLSFKVKLGGKAFPEKVVRLQVRPVNECLFTFIDSAGNTNDISYFFAAYVNENHPFINQILKEAIQSGRVDSFEGYSDDPDNKESVKAQIKAVWEALQERGIRYGAMPASADDDNPYLESQYVRLLGESINYTQANCVDGSVLLASIFRKIGLNVSLIEIPGHMFIGVGLDPEGKDNIYIETTDLGQSAFEEALEDGKNEYEEAKGKFNSEKEDEQDYNIVNVQDARRMGIMPIKDSSSRKITDKGNHPTVVEDEKEEDTDE